MASNRANKTYARPPKARNSRKPLGKCWVFSDNSPTVHTVLLRSEIRQCSTDLIFLSWSRILNNVLVSIFKKNYLAECFDIIATFNSAPVLSTVTKVDPVNGDPVNGLGVNNDSLDDFAVTKKKALSKKPKSIFSSDEDEVDDDTFSPVLTKAKKEPDLFDQ